MAFTPEAARQLLQHVNGTQASISTTSSKFVFWKRHAADVVKLWEQAFMQADTDKRLVLLYLMNDVVQTSKRQTKNYVQEFHQVVPEAFKRLLHTANDDIKRSLCKLVRVWRDRDVWGHKAQKMYNDMIRDIPDGEPAHRSSSPAAPAPELAALHKALADAHAAGAELEQRRGDNASAQAALQHAMPPNAVPIGNHVFAVNNAVKANQRLQAAEQACMNRWKAVQQMLTQQLGSVEARLADATDAHSRTQAQASSLAEVQQIVTGAGMPAAGPNVASANMPPTAPDLMGSAAAQAPQSAEAAATQAALASGPDSSAAGASTIASGTGSGATAVDGAQQAGNGAPDAARAPPQPDPDDIPTDLLLDALERQTHMDPNNTAQLFSDVFAHASTDKQEKFLESVKDAINS